MEKINTPLGELIEEFERLKSESKTIADKLYLDGVISVLQSRLPKEQKIIQLVHKAGQQRCTSKPSEHLAKNYYQKTFKEYE